MATSSTKRSGIKAGLKYFRSLVGNLRFPWIDTVWRTATANSTMTSVSRLVVFNEFGEGLGTTNNPGSMPGVFNFGLNVTTTPQIGYTSNGGYWNGWFLGNGNYITSNLGYKQRLSEGWTQITGYSGYSGVGGIGTGGYTSAGVPIWIFPVTTGSVVHSVLYTTTMPTTSWTLNNTIGTVSGSTTGSQNKVAIANDIVAYGYHSSTSRNASNLVIKYATITPSTGAISTTWNTATFDFAIGGGASGTLNNLVSINGTFVLVTDYGDVYTSTNGANFTRRITGAGVFNFACTTESDGYLLSVSPTNGFQAQYTQDGITWTQMPAFGGGVIPTVFGLGKGIRYAANGTTVYRNF